MQRRMTPASNQLIDHHVDPFGLPLTLQRPESLPAVHGFIEGFLGYEPRILDILQVAIPEGEYTDDSPIVRAYAAALHMFSESREGPEGARAHLQRASAASAHLERADAANALPATARELSVPLYGLIVPKPPLIRPRFAPKDRTDRHHLGR